MNRIDLWRNEIVHALETNPMTANDLISHVLAEHYGNIDQEAESVISALNTLIQDGLVQVASARIKTGKAETLLKSAF